eukprot:3332464-Alexandrium_andersonii.AAC.1
MNTPPSRGILGFANPVVQLPRMSCCVSRKKTMWLQLTVGVEPRVRSRQLHGSDLVSLRRTWFDISSIWTLARSVRVLSLLSVEFWTHSRH